MCGVTGVNTRSIDIITGGCELCVDTSQKETKHLAHNFWRGYSYNQS